MTKVNTLQKWLLAIVLVLVVGLAACQGDNAGDNQEDEENSDQQTEEQANEEEESSGEEASKEEGSSFESVTLTDKSGEEVTIEEKPEKIVTVIPSSTEIVFAVGAGDHVVGVDKWSNYPEEVADLEKVGDMNLNIEKIVELEPDLVVADLNNAESIDSLRSAGLNVVVTGAQSLEEVYADIEMIGQATGYADQANDLVDDMKNRVDEIESAVSEIPEEERKKVWLEVGPELYSGGEGSFINELITLAGGENIISDQEGWPQISEELIIERNPDVIFTTYGSYTENVEEQVLSRENWQDISAIQNEEVYDIHGDQVTRPGPRLVEGLEAIAEHLYPDQVE
ncbi:ABC transporter substrate-binding protein [Halalkalibacillus sediminis]|uniref:ABC transporter substrate-binding protein n=1 Tax=Halalkalibacillus sediminis TaxID=2018042 RepID=A0A2I0QRS3_9BACI|nr:ABC transporter substrate-binding protein [Halalkalibacillus sediminis]PKR77045.1 ABC transporter substrate-binding protein [Halalkalibacillus sediminis]